MRNVKYKIKMLSKNKIDFENLCSQHQELYLVNLPKEPRNWSLWYFAFKLQSSIWFSDVARPDWPRFSPFCHNHSSCKVKSLITEYLAIQIFNRHKTLLLVMHDNLTLYKGLK